MNACRLLDACRDLGQPSPPREALAFSLAVAAAGMFYLALLPLLPLSLLVGLLDNG